MGNKVLKLKKDTSRYVLAAFLFESGGSKGLFTEIDSVPELLLFLSLESKDLKEVLTHIDSRLEKSPGVVVPDWHRFLNRIKDRIGAEITPEQLTYYQHQLTNLLSLHYQFPPELVVSAPREILVTDHYASPDSEIHELLREVSEMNWESEIELFRQGIIDRKVDLELEQLAVDGEEEDMKIGAKYGAAFLGFFGLFVSKELILLFSILGFIGLGISLTFLMGAHGLIFAVILIVAGILFTSFGVGSLLSLAGVSPIVGCLSFALVGAVVGAAINLKLRRHILLSKRDILAAPLRDKHSMLVLEPMELLSFWENRASIYIMSRISRIEEQLGLMKKNMNESLNLEKKMVGREPGLIDELRSSRRMTQKSIDDALQMKEGLAILHSRFRDKVYDLKALVEREKEIEKNAYLEEELQGKIQKAIKRGARLRKSWEEDRSRLQSEIEGMAITFQEQLFQSKDFLVAHMQLENDSQISNSE